MVYSQSLDSNQRSKRSPARRKGPKVRPPYKGLTGQCQLHPFYFDFYLGGWDDWIVDPTGLSLNLCFGYCPLHMDDNMNTTNNAIIQQVNILVSIHQHFTHGFFSKSVLHSFSVLTVWLCNFFAQEYCAKAACKMLIKLTQETSLEN